jgi:acyl dehydratase
MRVPITRLTCDTPGCTAAKSLEYGETAEPEWFMGRHGDHCPAHQEEERSREWRPFKGPVHGTPGWQSLRTNRVVYQATAPTSAAAHEGTSSVEEA